MRIGVQGSGFRPRNIVGGATRYEGGITEGADPTASSTMVSAHASTDAGPVVTRRRIWSVFSDARPSPPGPSSSSCRIYGVRVRIDMTHGVRVRTDMTHGIRVSVRARADLSHGVRARAGKR